MTHIPAPWTWIEGEDSLIVIPDDGRGRHRGGLYGINLCAIPKTSPNAIGNAHLIATAPELYHLLRQLVARIEGDPGRWASYPHTELEEAHAAIEKANSDNLQP